MNKDRSTWEKWRAPYDPRQVNGITVSEDGIGQMVGIADCGISCPGCGRCCRTNELRVYPRSVKRAHDILLD
jgi:hypothetical protein